MTCHSIEIEPIRYRSCLLGVSAKNHAFIEVQFSFKLYVGGHGEKKNHRVRSSFNETGGHQIQKSHGNHQENNKKVPRMPEMSNKFKTMSSP